MSGHSEDISNALSWTGDQQIKQLKEMNKELKMIRKALSVIALISCESNGYNYFSEKMEEQFREGDDNK